MANQDTGKFRTNDKDQFYTKPAIAKLCVEKLLEIRPDAASYRWIEPSAGSGSFFSSVPPGTELVAIDIDPKRSDIQKRDFLTWMPPTTQKQTLLLGNPPFGKQASLARKFIGKGVSISDIIAFILPRSFMKPSMQKAFPGHFHLILEHELPSHAFLVNGADHDVPCVFQVWEKRTEKRTDVEQVKPCGFHYVKSTEPYDLAFRRVGGKAGVTFATPGAYAIQAHYFIVLEDGHKHKKDSLAEQLSKHVFPSNTTGPRSLSKGELNEVLNALLSQP